MSADTIGPLLAAAILMGLGLITPPAQASDSPWGVPDVLEDPLLSRPPVLDEGVMLPGDPAPVTCPVEIHTSQPLTLVHAVDIALCQDPQLKATWAAIKIQAAMVGQARAAYLPTLSGSMSRQRNDTRYPALPETDRTVTGYSSYVSLNWRLFDFGERDANRRAANDLLTAALSSYDAALQKTLAATVEAYFAALTAQAAYLARAQTSHLAQETLDAAHRREARGATGRSDTLQAATALARARLAEQRAAGEADKAMATLVYTLGIAAGTRLELPQDRPVPVKRDIADLAQWLNAAKERHPAIIAARQQWEAARLKIVSTRSQGLPTVDFAANFYQNGYPNQAVQATRSNTAIIGVTLNIPFFEGFARTYRVREAQAQADQREAQIGDTEREVLGEIVKRHADAVSTLANLDASAILLETAETALASSRKRYVHGVADILEVLNVQASLADAQQERIRSESEWRSARLRLRAAASVLGREQIRDPDSDTDASRAASRERRPVPPS